MSSQSWALPWLGPHLLQSVYTAGISRPRVTLSHEAKKDSRTHEQDSRTTSRIRGHKSRIRGQRAGLAEDSRTHATCVLHEGSRTQTRRIPGHTRFPSYRQGFPDTRDVRPTLVGLPDNSDPVPILRSPGREGVRDTREFVLHGAGLEVRRGGVRDTRESVLHRASGRGTGDPQEIGTYWLAIARGCRTATSNHCGLGGHGRSRNGHGCPGWPAESGSPLLWQRRNENAEDCQRPRACFCQVPLRWPRRSAHGDRGVGGAPASGGQCQATPETDPLATPKLTPLWINGTALTGLSTLCPRRRSPDNQVAVGKGWVTPSTTLADGCFRVHDAAWVAGGVGAFSTPARRFSRSR